MTTLREALERAMASLPVDDTEAREQITFLLKQKGENREGEFVPLVEDCELCIHG